MTEPTTILAIRPAAEGSGADPRQRWIWPIRIVTLVLAAVMLSAGAASVIGVFFIRHSTRTTVFTEPVKTVEVSTDTGSITVRAATAGQPTTLISRGQSAFRTAQHSAAVKDGVLMASGACHGSFIIADSCSMSFELTVPAGSAILLHSDNGNIRVVGVGGSVRLRTDTGNVTGDLLKSDTVSAQTDTGDVTLGFSTSPHQLRAVADTGDVQIRVPDDASVYRVQAGTDTGNRLVNVPTAVTSDRSIVAESSTGNVHVLTLQVP